jgi:hypothetical protein
VLNRKGWLLIFSTTSPSVPNLYIICGFPPIQKNCSRWNLGCTTKKYFSDFSQVCTKKAAQFGWAAH